MANFEDIAKKAFYMGVGFASYAQEKAIDAIDNVKDLRIQAQKLADEMIERGEINTEEARKFVDELVEQAQQGVVIRNSNHESDEKQPRRIEIVDEDESTAQSAAKTDPAQSTQSNPDSENLRQQVQSLQEELRRLFFY